MHCTGVTYVSEQVLPMSPVYTGGRGQGEGGGGQGEHNKKIAVTPGGRA